MGANDLEGRVAVVTGASSGIGRATAEMLIARGAVVAIFSRSREKLESIAAVHGGRMIAVAGDAASSGDVDRLFDETEARLGDCDLLVTSAGMIDAKLMSETTPEEWDRMFAVNTRGVYLAARRALPSMMARRTGSIVNVASISGVPGPQKFPGFVSYCASKGAVIALTEALAVEVRDYGVRVNCVSPGSVDTPMWSQASGGAPASMTAEEVAEVILFLGSDRSRPINGQSVNVFSS